MKNFGWICIVIGSMSFMGAIVKGDKAVGPTFMLALGIYLLYRVNQKKKEFEKSERWRKGEDINNE